MDFLKAILEAGLYTQLETAISTYNSEHADTPCKIGNLSSGEYVSTAKHTTLETERNALKTQLETLNGELTTLRGKKSTDADTKAALDALQTILGFSLCVYFSFYNIKPPKWRFYDTPFRRFAQNLG